MSREESHTKVIVPGVTQNLLAKDNPSRASLQHADKTCDNTVHTQLARHPHTNTYMRTQMSHHGYGKDTPHTHRSFPSPRQGCVRLTSFKWCILSQINLFLNPAKPFCYLTIKLQVGRETTHTHVKVKKAFWKEALRANFSHYHTSPSNHCPLGTRAAQYFTIIPVTSLLVQIWY